MESIRIWIGKYIVNIVMVLAFFLSTYFLLINRVGNLEAKVSGKLDTRSAVIVIRDNVEKEFIRYQPLFYSHEEGQVLSTKLDELKEQLKEIKELLNKNRK